MDVDGFVVMTTTGMDDERVSRDADSNGKQCGTRRGVALMTQ